jgi:hypothetical protein
LRLQWRHLNTRIRFVEKHRVAVNRKRLAFQIRHYVLQAFTQSADRHLTLDGGK